MLYFLENNHNFFRFNFEEGLPAQNFDSFVKALLTVFQVFKFTGHLNKAYFHQELTSAQIFQISRGTPSASSSQNQREAAC